MASNGTVDSATGYYYALGSGAWSSLTSGWTAFTSWTISPPLLEYNSAIIDLGQVRSFKPVIDVYCDGVARIELKYSETSSDLSSATTTVGNLSAMYSSLGYYESGYSDASYEPLTARYIKITVHVSNTNAAGTEQVANLYSLNYNFDDRLIEEFQPRVNTQSLQGLAISDGSLVSGTLNNVTKRIIVPTKTYGLITTVNVQQNQIGASDTSYHVVPEIQYDKDSTGRIYYVGHDMDRWDRSHSDSIIDVTIRGLGEVQEFANGSIG